MIKMFDEESYYSFKVFELLLTESNLKEWIDNNPVLSTSEFLTCFLIFLGPFLEKQYLSPRMKNNALNYLNLVRFNNSEEVIEKIPKSEKIELINSIIRLINTQDSNNCFDFYLQEIYKRTSNRKYLSTLNKKVILSIENDIFESIKFDHFVLLSHSNQVSDELFLNEFLPIILNDLRYFKSINCIIKEFPNQFKNPLFIQRYQTVITNFLAIQTSVLGCKTLVSFNKKVVHIIKK